MLLDMMYVHLGFRGIEEAKPLRCGGNRERFLLQRDAF